MIWSGISGLRRWQRFSTGNRAGVQRRLLIVDDTGKQPTQFDHGGQFAALVEGAADRVGARIDRGLWSPIPACVSADASRDRHAQTCHPVEHVASDFCLDALLGQSPCVKSSADDGLVAKHRRLNQA